MSRAIGGRNHTEYASTVTTSGGGGGGSGGGGSGSGVALGPLAAPPHAASIIARAPSRTRSMVACVPVAVHSAPGMTDPKPLTLRDHLTAAGLLFFRVATAGMMLGA